MKPVKNWDYVLGKRYEMSISQWNRWKIYISFGKMIWNQVFLSETVGKSRLCFGKMIWNWVFDIKKSWFMIISIWIFIKRIAISNLNQYFIKNCHFHIVSYLIVSYQYQIVSYQFLVLILWSHPCLVWREKNIRAELREGKCSFSPMRQGGSWCTVHGWKA